MSPEPFVFRAKALPAKRSEKGYGDENREWAIGISGYHGRDPCVQVAGVQGSVFLRTLLMSEESDERSRNFD